MSLAAGAHRARGLLSRRVLYLIILPTERCQLRCTYCYQDYEHGRMPPAIVAGLENWIERQASSLRLLVLEWFGGEPLLATDIVERVQAFASKLVHDQPRLAMRGMMTTNAMLLDPDRLRRLTAAGVGTFLVALDGPAPVHDRLRVTAGGGGTFDRIWANLIRARDTDLDFVVHLRLHVSEDNAEALPAFLLELREAFGGDDRFLLALRAIHQPGLRSDRTAPVLGDWRRRRSLEEMAQGLGLGLHHQADEGPRPKAGCYAAAANSFVVRPDGQLAKCTLALGHPENRVGRLRPDGTVDLDQERMQIWLRGIYSGDRRELGCPAQGPVFHRQLA